MQNDLTTIITQHEPALFIRRWLKRTGLCQTYDGVKGILVIAGPPASGKKRVARYVVETLKQDKLHLHMGEFAFADDIGRLLGTKGILTEWIAAHPDSIIVFEDIDECDHSIQRAIAAIGTDGAPGAPERYRDATFLFLFKIKSPEWAESAFIDRYYAQPLLEQARLYESLATVGTADENGAIHPLFDPEMLNVMSETDLVLLYAHDLPGLQTITERILKESLEQWQKSTGTAFTVEHSSALAQALLLSFSPYLNSTRVAHRLPFYLYDLVFDGEKQPAAVTFDISKDARNWLRATFATESDLRNFGKYDRRFSLGWERTDNGGETVVRLQEIGEHSTEIPTNPVADRLFIHPIGQEGFAQIAGQKRVKKHLESLIQLLQNKQGLERFGITLPKGLLLYGPEGVGKSMLVRAFAKEAGLPYISLRGSDLFDEELIDAAYQRARQAAPLIVILENVDVKGIIEGNYTPIPTEALGAAIDHSPDAPERFVFTVMTAQEKAEVPKALMHPGRIDQFVEVPELDKEARLFFARKLLEKPHEKVDTDRITRYMSGMSGYELDRIAKACALEAIRQGKTKLTEQIIIDEINTIKYGSRLDKKRLKNFEEDLRRSAYHEAAHAVTSLALLPEVEIEQVTVIPRTETLGFVSYSQDELQANMSLEEFRGNIAVALAGRIATIKQFEEDKGVETGAYSDLQQATMYAYSAVALYGMDETLRNINIELLQQNVSNTYFEKQVEARITHWIDEGTKQAEAVIKRHWKTIETIAQRLVKEEFVEGSELKTLFAEN